MTGWGKGFLDGENLSERLSAMKNLAKFGLLLIVSGTFSSCGIPMAAVRTAQNTVRTAVSTTSSVLGY